MLSSAICPRVHVVLFMFPKRAGRYVAVGASGMYLACASEAFWGMQDDVTFSHRLWAAPMLWAWGFRWRRLVLGVQGCPTELIGSEL